MMKSNTLVSRSKEGALKGGEKGSSSKKMQLLNRDQREEVINSTKNITHLIVAPITAANPQVLKKTLEQFPKDKGLAGSLEKIKFLNLSYYSSTSLEVGENKDDLDLKVAYATELAKELRKIGVNVINKPQNHSDNDIQSVLKVFQHFFATNHKSFLDTTEVISQNSQAKKSDDLKKEIIHQKQTEYFLVVMQIVQQYVLLIQQICDRDSKYFTTSNKENNTQNKGSSSNIRRSDILNHCYNAILFFLEDRKDSLKSHQNLLEVLYQLGNVPSVRRGSFIYLLYKFFYSKLTPDHLKDDVTTFIKHLFVGKCGWSLFQSEDPNFADSTKWIAKQKPTKEFTGWFLTKLKKLRKRLRKQVEGSANKNTDDNNNSEAQEESTSVSSPLLDLFPGLEEAVLSEKLPIIKSQAEMTPVLSTLFDLMTADQDKVNQVLRGVVGSYVAALEDRLKTTNLVLSVLEKHEVPKTKGFFERQDQEPKIDEKLEKKRLKRQRKRERALQRRQASDSYTVYKETKEKAIAQLKEKEKEKPGEAPTQIHDHLPKPVEKKQKIVAEGANGTANRHTTAAETQANSERKRKNVEEEGRLTPKDKQPQQQKEPVSKGQTPAQTPKSQQPTQSQKASPVPDEEEVSLTRKNKKKQKTLEENSAPTTTNNSNNNNQVEIAPKNVKESSKASQPVLTKSDLISAKSAPKKPLVISEVNSTTDATPQKKPTAQSTETAKNTPKNTNTSTNKNTPTAAEKSSTPSTDQQKKRKDRDEVAATPPKTATPQAEKQQGKPESEKTPTTPKATSQETQKKAQATEETTGPKTPTTRGGKQSGKDQPSTRAASPASASTTASSQPIIISTPNLTSAESAPAESEAAAEPVTQQSPRSTRQQKSIKKGTSAEATVNKDAPGASQQTTGDTNAPSKGQETVIPVAASDNSKEETGDKSTSTPRKSTRGAQTQDLSTDASESDSAVVSTGTETPSSRQKKRGNTAPDATPVRRSSRLLAKTQKD